MPLRGTTSDKIREFHAGPTYARTKAKFGKAKADRQAIAAAISKRKGNSMDGMRGEKGMSPRKAMASSSGGSFGAGSYHDMNGGSSAHPDAAAGTGEKGAMGEGERATPPGIHHTKGHHPAQAAPRHGSTMDNFRRDGKA